MEQRTVPRNRLFLFGSLFIFILSSCNFPTTPQVPSTAEIITAVVATLTAEGLSTPTQAPPTPTAMPLLPHSLYFLSPQNGSNQVSRLERDGLTRSQITNESLGIESYDVSRQDGRVAYVTDNQLYLIDSDGGNRQLFVDNAEADPEAANYYYVEHISDPRFSPDGRYLAYAQNGIWILDLATSEAQHVLDNQIETAEDGSAQPFELYFPLEWAPDSRRLLVSIALGEGGLLGILDPSGDPLLLRFDSLGIFCCQASWAPDSGSVLLASPYLGVVDAGLWRYDASTGDETTLLETVSGGLYTFAGWPLQLPNDDLQYFFTSSAEIPEGDQLLYMVHSAADGVSGRTQLRSEGFDILDALWVEDGSLALIVQAGSIGTGLSGPVVLVFSDGRQLQVLLDEAQRLRWGP